mmetsp:Transcript_12736/g.27771  ORF Transcript_12736/g.27771 Transcript_12736/m.27771 type:complete len:142 (+) Transcript_12736:68-493(+)
MVLQAWKSVDSLFGKSEQLGKSPRKKKFSTLLSSKSFLGKKAKGERKGKKKQGDEVEEQPVMSATEKLDFEEDAGVEEVDSSPVLNQLESEGQNIDRTSRVDSSIFKPFDVAEARPAGQSLPSSRSRMFALGIDRFSSEGL